MHDCLLHVDLLTQPTFQTAANDSTYKKSYWLKAVLTTLSLKDLICCSLFLWLEYCTGCWNHYYRIVSFGRDQEAKQCIDETWRPVCDNSRDCHLYAPVQLHDTAMQTKHPLIHNTWNDILCPRLCDGNEMSAQKLTIATTEYFYTSKDIAAYEIAAMQHKLNF